VLEFLAGSLAGNPLRVGHPLQRELAGLHSARRGEYRVIYEVMSAIHEIRVLRVHHRRDVYYPR